MVKYLDKIIDHCNEKEVEIYFVRSRQHQLTPNLRNEAIFMSIRNERFNEVELLDFNQFPIENSEFVDFEHINYKGARKFSTWFDSLLELDILSMENKQLFIDQKIEEEALLEN